MNNLIFLLISSPPPSSRDFPIFTHTLKYILKEFLTNLNYRAIISSSKNTPILPMVSIYLLATFLLFDSIQFSKTSSAL